MKILQYSNADGSHEYLVPVDLEKITPEIVAENQIKGCTLDGVFDLIPLNPFRGCHGMLREGAEYVRRG